MTNPVIFKYKLTGPGVAEGMLGIGDQSVSYLITNTGNPLADLLRGMVSLVFDPSHLWDEDNVHQIEWYGDEKSYKWILSTHDGDIINIKVTEYTDFFDDSTGTLRINQFCKLNEFYPAIIIELDNFLKNTGLLNYEQKWQKDEFPLTYFLILKKILLEKGLWNGDKTRKGTLDEEIDILMI
ncbi:MAG: hypothetical protein GXO47_02895 [Chlorobi bacterium]|nr:hypothetical protein [Chlorobiota bacterium]